MDKKVEVTYEAVNSMLAEVLQCDNFVPKLVEMEDEISKLLIAKNHDYGNAWQRYGVFTPLIRINDKLLRVQTLVGGREALIADEKIEDTLKDIIGYATLCLMWLEHQEIMTKYKHAFPEIVDYIKKLPDYKDIEVKVLGQCDAQEMSMWVDYLEDPDGGVIEIPPYTDKETIDKVIDDVTDNEFGENEMTGSSFDECCGDDKLTQ